VDYQPIENYGVIGNMRSLALVSVTGSIDFFCFPKFDSPTVFAALLDTERGGFFCIQPSLAETRTKQLYLPDTNILLTRFLSEDGIAEMTDFMPVLGKDHHSHVVRRVQVLKGEIDLTLHCHPRFDYARAQHKVERDGNAVIFRPATNQSAMVLNSSIALKPEDSDVVQTFRLKTGETAVFTFGEDCEEARRPLDDESVQRKFEETSSFWRAWAACIERELSVDTLVYRYRTQAGVDGLSGIEGSFTACSFWLIEALARSRQLEKARLLFEKMLGYANHVGLYAEQLGRSGQHLGNFPQALTHLALISAATYLDRELDGRQEHVWR
jgi:GH15 family glucan-1,4-alpha-glucosidase